MFIKKAFKVLYRKISRKIIDFIQDESGGNLVEYALLIGFGLFIFFLLVSIITNMLDWTVNQSNEFFKVVDELED
jgi:Flp pilus assembly pilin Flp